MRRIIKGEEPEELRFWKQQNADVPENLTYDNMPKAEIKMLAEQGYLCAYTMQRIPTVNDCHIEHIVPRSQDETLQISCTNLLACTPSNRPGHRSQRGKCPFGAEEKDRTPIYDNNFISPLREDVERRFRYALNGSVGHFENDAVAKRTITILRLNHEQLIDLRRAAIEERILDLEPSLSAQEAEELSKTIMTANSVGRIPEFCLAISHAAVWYANMASGARLSRNL
jgi:uncharacterized protein (TIGR02646 family)